ncbi:MAG: beta-glucosidase [Anaerolineae bacterium]|nr:beta-glucosidase [Anaerolineae bacterium]
MSKEPKATRSSKLCFPDHFVWGAATAAYQVEGASAADGKGLSVWDAFCQQPQKIFGGHSGEVACDTYHRFSDDIRLMKAIGLQAYRFSISWPRVLPKGVGQLNQKGIDFYSRLVDELLSAGITPYVTLFHWDYPYELYLAGGWLNPNSPDWFAEYSSKVVERLSDRVTNWMTINEPQAFIGLGHWEGTHAPGLKLPWNEVLIAAHHVLLAHGKSVLAIRASACQRVRVGIASVGSVKIPLSNSTEDIEAARKAMFAVTDYTFWNNSWFADPIFFKQYPEDGLRLYGSQIPSIRSGDMDIIAQPLDFYGANIYRGDFVRANQHNGYQLIDFPAGYPLTHFYWAVTPQALYWGPKFLYERYRTPIIITENGLSTPDWVAADNQVHDPQRIDFTSRYLSALRQAYMEGVDIRGYFHWSLMDNFEWAEGYRQRFGLIYVDFQTQKRILKESASWYKNVISSNGCSLPLFNTEGWIK